jgi:pyruvoyl-dependent arginine decarboxylase (PvlArgDC)
MRIRKVFTRRIAHDEDGVSIAGGITAAISANVNEAGQTTTRVSSSERIVQRSGADRDAAAGDEREAPDTDEGGRNG